MAPTWVCFGRSTQQVHTWSLLCVTWKHKQFCEQGIWLNIVYVKIWWWPFLSSSFSAVTDFSGMERLVSVFWNSAFKNISKDYILFQKRPVENKSFYTTYPWMQTKEVHLLGFGGCGRKRTLAVEPQLQMRRAVEVTNLFVHIHVKLLRTEKQKTKKRYRKVTSVPWRLVACVANVFIFSLYSWAALLLYLALAALVVHPCWLKNAICHQKRRH